VVFVFGENGHNAGTAPLDDRNLPRPPRSGRRGRRASRFLCRLRSPCKNDEDEKSLREVNPVPHRFVLLGDLIVLRVVDRRMIFPRSCDERNRMATIAENGVDSVRHP
jgi:hypothetical protein